MATKYATQKSNYVKLHGEKRDLVSPIKWDRAIQELQQILQELETKHANKLAAGDTVGAGKVLEKIELVKSTIANKQQQQGK